MKVANRDCRSFVQKLHPFKGNNLEGTYWCANPSSVDPGDSGYAVLSYGYWPLFVCIHLQGRDVWFENTDRYSITTSKHRSQSHPHQPTQPLTNDEAKLLIAKGYTALVQRRITV